MKSQLNYAPLYASVYILQLVAVLTIAAERMAGDLRVGFVAMFAPVLAGTLLFGYAKRDWVASRGQPVQFLPLLVMPALIAFWVTFVGPRYLFIIAGLSLLAGRNLVLVTRRSLYFDLAIATTAFYDAIGLQTSLRFGLLAAAFLVALVFVLMADYADQRLDLERADGEARAALAPNLGNAGLATVLVLVAGTLIYWLIPQPPAGRYGIPDPDAAFISRYSAADKAGILPAKPEPEDKSEGKGEAGKLLAAAGPGAAAGGTGDPPKLDISRSARPSPGGPLTALALSKNGKADTKTKPSDSGTQLGQGADGKSGAKGKPPGAEDRKSESKGEPSDSGKPQAGKGDQGKDGANPADAGESQAK